MKRHVDQILRATPLYLRPTQQQQQTPAASPSFGGGTPTILVEPKVEKPSSSESDDFEECEIAEDTRPSSPEICRSERTKKPVQRFKYSE